MDKLSSSTLTSTSTSPVSTSTSTFDVSSARAWLAARDRRRAERRRRLWAQAKQDADAIVAMIIEHHSPVRIYQWGSVIEPAHFAEYSDIDIAVEGLRGAEEYFALIGQAEKLTRFPIDIVELEHIEPEFARLIRSQGRLRHEH
ncbi:MAG: nucleotidyltransferase domain-containing protein [candidate division WOR-3 bacterium]|nr:nucleotidyltransferase domain-containing protein [candidate division WOR-3 bacterium]